MKLKTWRDDQSSEQVWEFRFSVIDLAGVDLDRFDRAVLVEPRSGIADVLMDLQIVAFRLEQQSAGDDS